MSWGDFVQVVFKLCSSCVQVVTSGQGLVTSVFLVTPFSNCVVAMLHSARTCQIVIHLSSECVGVMLREISTSRVAFIQSAQNHVQLLVHAFLSLDLFLAPLHRYLENKWHASLAQ